MSDKLKKYLKSLKEPEEPTIDDEIKRISQFSKEGRFAIGKDAYKSEMDFPALESAREVLYQSADELKSAGKSFKEGSADSILRGLFEGGSGLLHTAISPITAPFAGVSEGLKSAGLSPIAEGIERTFDLPFALFRGGSQLTQKGLESVGLDPARIEEAIGISPETSKAGSDFLTELGGLGLLAKGHKTAKNYVDKTSPKIKELEPSFEIKPKETKSVEGLTQEKLPTELMDAPKDKKISKEPVKKDAETKVEKTAKEIIEEQGAKYDGVNKKGNISVTNKETGRTLQINEKDVTPESIQRIINQTKEGKPNPPIEKATKDQIQEGLAKGREIRGEPPMGTTIKNEVVNAERKARGLEPIETSMKRDFQSVWDEAQAKINKEPKILETLPKELSEKPRPVTDTESAILTYNRERIKAEHQKILDKSEKTPQDKVDILKLEEELNMNELATKHTGSEVARALNIRKMEIKDDFTLAPLVQRARTANKNQPVPQEVRTRLEEYSKKIVDGEKRARELEAKIGNLEVEKTLNTYLERTEKRGKAKKDLDAEYDSLVKEFASTMQLNALVDPKQVQLMTKMAINRLQKGGLTIEQVIDQVYQASKGYIKDLTVDDVRNALSEAGRFAKPTQREIKSEIRDIKKSLSEEKIGERLQKSYKTRLENRKAELEKMLETGNFEKTPRRKTPMNPELTKLKDEVDILKQRADREIRILERKNMPTAQKVRETIIDIANVPRTIKASFDLSAPWRQGIILSTAYPKIIHGRGGAFREQIRYFGSDKALRELQRYIEESPNASLYNKSKLYLANEKTNIGRVTGREEAFMSTLPEKIWGLGIGIKASNRAYAGFLDKARMDVFDYHVTEFQKMGLTFDKNPKVYKDLAKAINTMSGRGTLGGFEKSAAALSIGIFSPRLIASRLQMLSPRFYFNLEPQVRKIVMKDMLKFVGTGLSILTMAKLAGADVEPDPTSSDFGKIKVGNTRIDVWGGFQQYGVLASRMMMGQTKGLDGKIRKLDGKGFPFTTRKDVLQRFAEQKLSPSAGFIRDLLADKSFMGDKFEWDEQAIDLMIPLFLKDMYEAIETDGIEGALLTLPAVFGVGAQTFENKPKRGQK